MRPAGRCREKPPSPSTARPIPVPAPELRRRPLPLPRVDYLQPQSLPPMTGMNKTNKNNARIKKLVTLTMGLIPPSIEV